MHDFHAYAKSLVNALGEYQRTDSVIYADENVIQVPKMLTTIVTKISYYGYGMKLVPKADIQDGRIHVLAANSRLPIVAIGILESFTIGSRVGKYVSAKTVIVKASAEQQLQMNGTLYSENASEFKFTVLPGALRMVY
jgi:diacylglycerol kinase family enzyme